MSDKWAAISKEVCVALWSEPNARLSKGDRWRWGNKGSRSLEADKGVWKDFEADKGGGVRNPDSPLFVVICKRRKTPLTW